MIPPRSRKGGNRAGRKENDSSTETHSKKRRKLPFSNFSTFPSVGEENVPAPVSWGSDEYPELQGTLTGLKQSPGSSGPRVAFRAPPLPLPCHQVPPQQLSLPDVRDCVSDLLQERTAAILKDHEKQDNPTSQDRGQDDPGHET